MTAAAVITARSTRNSHARRIAVIALHPLSVAADESNASTTAEDVAVMLAYARQVVIVPERPVDLGAGLRLGWWLVDPVSGTAVDQMDDGGGQNSGLYIGSLAIGVAISLFQALTQIQEMTLVFVPKIVAVFAGASRKHAWRVRKHTSILTVFGGAELDLTQAIFEARDVEMTVFCLFGGIELTVPPGTDVDNQVMAVLGGSEVGNGPSDLQCAIEPSARQRQAIDGAGETRSR